MPELTRIRVYPIKALDGVEIESVPVRGEGWINYDRQYAMFDADGNYVNGRQNDLVHKIESSIDLESGDVELSIYDTGTTYTTNLDSITEDDGLEEWLSDFFGEPVAVKRAQKSNFTDSAGGIVPYRISATGPTIVSVETLEEVASWYDDLDVENIRRRLRTNFEICGGGAFWEDRLFTDVDHAVDFRIGDVTHYGMMSKPRCVTPSRDPETGELNKNFSKTFIENRRESFPDWADEDHLGEHIEADIDHYYYLTVVTRIPGTEEGKEIAVGDEVEIRGKVPLLQTL
jgi:uncharacterized protein YcbX